MSKNFILSKSIIIFILISYSLASKADILTLDQALAIADKENPQAKAALSQIEVARAEKLIAGAFPNPSLVTDNGIRSEQTYRFVGLEGTFELGGKRGGRIKVAEKLVEESAIQAQTVLRDIHVQVHKAYAELSVGEEQLKLVQSRFEVAKKIYEQIEIRSKVGDSSGLDLVRARSSFNLNQIDLERAKTNLIKSQIKLNALLGFPANQIVQTENIKELKPSYEKLHDHPQLTQIKEDAMNNRLELALVRAKQNTQEANVNLARRQFVPDLTIAAGPSLNVGNPLGVFVVGKMTLPIFGSARGQIAKSQAQLNQLQLEQASLHNKIESEINLAYQELEVAEANYFTYKDNLLSQAAELEQMVSYGVEKGAFKLTDLFVLQNETKQLREKYLQTLLDYQFALAELERAIGKPLIGFGRSL